MQKSLEIFNGEETRRTKISELGKTAMSEIDGRRAAESRDLWIYGTYRSRWISGGLVTATFPFPDGEQDEGSDSVEQRRVFIIPAA